MHIRELLHKTTAFTLAEMMVILTVMSVVMAATMPIITAPDSAMLGGTVSGDNLWTKGNNFKSISTANFVAVGMAPDVNTPSTGTAGLFINNKADESSPSQILFTVSPDGKTVYNAGRLYLGSMDTYNVAIGANALTETKLEIPAAVYNDYKNVAIGDWAMRRGSTSGRVGSVAIGSMAFYGSSPYNSVAIGYAALAVGSTQNNDNNVGIGYMAGYDGSPSHPLNRTVDIGYLAGYNTSSYGYRENLTNIGYQAGAMSEARHAVNIGYLAGFGNHPTDTGSNQVLGAVNIGTNAGAMPLAEYDNTSNDRSANYHVAMGDHALYAPMASVDEVVAIGSYAGYNLRGDTKGAVFIGNRAGYRIQQGNIRNYELVSIGSYANYNGVGTTVAIGYMAGSTKGAISNYAGSGRSQTQNDKKMNEIAIGHKAGASCVNSRLNSYGNIAIGHNALEETNNNNAVIKSICIGYGSCAPNTKAVYSILLGQYASANPNTGSNNKYPMFSVISPTWYTKASYLGLDGIHRNPKGGTVVLFDNSSSNRLLKYRSSDANNYSQMIIAETSLLNSPIGNDNDYNDSSVIILDATNIYGPTSKPTGYTSSDKTLKENVKPLKYSLAEINRLNVYEYSYQDEPDVRRIGVIAQELKKVIPEAVDISKKESFTINPDWVFYTMFNAVKELDKTVESCKSSLLAYAKEYQSLSIKMKSLEKEQKQLEKERKSLEKQINKAYRKAEKMEKSA